MTQATWEAFVVKPVKHADIRALTPDKVGRLYRAQYGDAIKGDALPSGVDHSVFDTAVNSGPTQAIKWLQRAVNASDDGVLGPKTLTAVIAAPVPSLIRQFNEQRIRFIQGLSSFSAFGKGWTSRVNEVELASSSTV